MPQLGSHPKILYVGVHFLQNIGEEGPPHKELGLSDLYAGGPFDSLCGYSLCVFFAPEFSDKTKAHIILTHEHVKTAVATGPGQPAA